MNRIPLLSFLLLFALTACHAGKEKVVINGKIIDKTSAHIKYTIPINGISYFGFTEDVQSDSLGNFKIIIDADKPAIVEFLKEFQSYGSVVIEPGMNYDILIDTELKEGAFKISCKNEEGQVLYNRIKNRSMAGGHFELEARDFYQNSNVDSIKQTLSSRREKEMSGFKNLLDKNIISQNFYSTIKSDREYFFAGALGSVAFINFISKSTGRNSLTEHQYKDLWKEVFQTNPISNPDILSSPWFYYYVQNYLRYKEFIVDSVDIKTISSFFKTGKIHTHYIESAKKYLTDPVLEYYYAAYIYYESVNRNYEKELITLFAEFKHNYPNSPYTKYLVPLVDEIVDFHKKAEQGFSDKYKFPENYDRMNSLSECLKTFRGKKVYIDTWATWCGPCKAEFKHNIDLLALLKSKNTEILYVSIDKDEDDQKWKDMIKFYSLEGYHIRASKELVEDLRRIFGQKGMLAIPWYILVDQKGTIIKDHAKPPSKLIELEKEISDI